MLVVVKAVLYILCEDSKNCTQYDCGIEVMVQNGLPSRYRANVEKTHWAPSLWK